MATEHSARNLAEPVIAWAATTVLTLAVGALAVVTSPGGAFDGPVTAPIGGLERGCESVSLISWALDEGSEFPVYPGPCNR